MGPPWRQLITLMLSMLATVSSDNSDLIVRISLKNLGLSQKSIELKVGVLCLDSFEFIISCWIQTR